MPYLTRTRVYRTADGVLCDEQDPAAHQLVYPAGIEILTDDAPRIAAYEDALSNGVPADEIEVTADLPVVNAEARTMTFGTSVPAPVRPKRQTRKKG